MRLTCSLCVLSADLALPVLSIEILEIPGQSLTPMKLCGEIDWRDVRMVLVLLDLLLHGRVDKVQSCCASLMAEAEGEKKWDRLTDKMVTAMSNTTFLSFALCNYE